MNQLNEILKKTRDIQQKVVALKSDLKKKETEVSSHCGMIQVRINGGQEVLNLRLDRKCINPEKQAGLEELVKETINQAIGESRKMVSNAMSEVGSLD